MRKLGGTAEISGVITFDRVSEHLIEAFKAQATASATAASALGKSFKFTPMAVPSPAKSWPFGTVLRPSDDTRSALRVMWIGDGDNGVVILNGVTAGERQTIRPGRWEVVPEDES